MAALTVRRRIDTQHSRAMGRYSPLYSTYCKHTRIFGNIHHTKMHAHMFVFLERHLALLLQHNISLIRLNMLKTRRVLYANDFLNVVYCRRNTSSHFYFF